MASQSDNLIAVNISSRFDPQDPSGTQFVCYVAENGTLADLRLVLLEDEIIKSTGRYAFVTKDGRVAGKSSEGHIKWTSVLKVRIVAEPAKVQLQS